MPFHYELQFPELVGDYVLGRQLIPERTYIQANTAIAILHSQERTLVLRNTGRGVLSNWKVKEGQGATSCQPFARMDADGEDIPHGRPYLVVEPSPES
jgi:hypothetical protein